MVHHDLTLWAYSLAFIFVAFCLDLYLERFKLKPNCFKTAAIISIGWIGVALLFNLFIWFYLRSHFNETIATQKTLEFFAGYLLEKSLSLDNLFVFILIFKYFNIPGNNQRPILNYGIIGAIVFRFLMIFFGIWLINQLHWILYVFGGLLIFSGAKMLLSSFLPNKENIDLDNNIIIKLCNKYLRTTKEITNNKFVITKNKKLYATPLLLALIAIELSDVIFAVDSIPAILVILHDPFIIFTSNIFAILGLRALYFFLALSVGKFVFLQQGIATILIFIGTKMTFGLKLPISITLMFMGSVITISIVASLIYVKHKTKLNSPSSGPKGSPPLS